MELRKQKILVISGPESSGKTTMGKHLADKLNGLYVPEFARTYLENQRNYNLEDVIKIAQGQKELIQAAVETGKEWIIVDTWVHVILIWAKVKFGLIPEELVQLVNIFDISLYLLCEPDIDWEPDDLRENEQSRTGLYAIYLKQMQQQKVPFVTISGTGKERLKNAELAISNSLNK